MMNKKEELIKLTPQTCQTYCEDYQVFSKGGLDKAERRELGSDLLELAYQS
jgi:hypothetical protein